MSKRNPHKTYCNYEISKATKPQPIYCVSAPKAKVTVGIRKANVSKAMLARQLAELF